MSFERISEKAAIISLESIKWLFKRVRQIAERDY